MGIDLTHRVIPLELVNEMMLQFLASQTRWSQNLK
jgi:hypothetical protein